ncbi:hypothetical protein [Niabella beijingensis]|uniref:hypothetical protein n=1 Tax=Niabella beijingensis TaxID=2872700 RepID=UPI001CBA9DFA|nr:hypothetical protein [Niabella beijingensis]MBZ4191112.1 hypothetical protein [Niabella beijingensis]
MRTILCAMALFILLPVCSTGQSRQFEDLLQKASIRFTRPNGFDTTAVLSKTGVAYQYALKHKTKQIEIRYYVNLLKERAETYRKIRISTPPGKNPATPDPNEEYRLTFSLLNLNTAADPVRPYFNKVYSKEKVTREFNADWGATMGYAPAPDFAKAYSFCILIGLHKADCADVYIFYLFNKTEVFDDLPMADLYALRFSD